MATSMFEASLAAAAIIRPQSFGQRLVVIESDSSLQESLHSLFTSEGYEVESLPNAFAALELLRDQNASAIVLDLGQAGSAQSDLCRELARAAPGMPLIVLSSNLDVVDKIVLLELGVDDCVTIPFSPRELVVRVRAIIRRAARPTPEISYTFDGIAVDILSMQVTRCGKQVQLTNKEFRTLNYLIKNANRVISRDELLNEVWGYYSYPCTRTVDNHILKLRQKLESDPSRPEHFVTMFGVGYKFVP